MENVDNSHGDLFYQPIQEPIEKPRPPVIQNPWLRILANLFSLIFHPILITSYVIYFLIFVHPIAFAGLDHRDKVFRFIAVLFSTSFLPLFSVFLLWRLGFGVQSILLRTQRERIIPYAIVMIFYWWVWNVFRNLPDIPPFVVHFLLGSFLAVCAAWFCNIYFKVSMHAISMGGLVMFLILFSFVDTYSSGLYLSIGVLIAGLVCSSRLLLGAHNNTEIYAGFFIGMLVQYIAWLF